MDGNSRMRQRHGGQVQIAFADGHVDRKAMDVVFINANEQGLAMWNRDGKPHKERLR